MSLASAKVSRTTREPAKLSSMPTDCEPCPGNTSANFMVFRSLHFNHRGAPREATAHAFEQHLVAALDTAVAYGNVQRKRNRSSRRVRVLVDGHYDFRRIDAELLCGRVEYANVCLVRYQPVDIVGMHIAQGERLTRHFVEHTHCVLEHRLPVHAQKRIAGHFAPVDRAGRRQYACLRAVRMQ